MKRFNFAVVMVSVLACVALAQREQDRTLNIIPPPQDAALKNVHFTIGPRTKIILGDNSNDERFAASQINEVLKIRGRKPLEIRGAGTIQVLPKNSLFIGSPASKLGGRLLSERKSVMKPEMSREGYFLDSDANGVVIIADSGSGRFYGVMTLLQMMHPGKSGIVVDGATIEDFPLMAMRGISDDISRGQVSTVSNFKKIIRFLARYKLNTYALYMEDMFAFKKHPLIGKGRGALTSDEVKELDTYAREYHVDLIPIFQTLGHWENILYQPEYVGYAEYPGGRTLNVSDNRVYALLDEMIGEISASFSSPYFNMGADETMDVGLGANKERVAKEGLSAVLAQHYSRVAAIIRKYGKKPMMYADIILKHPEILTMIPRDILMVDWDYDPRFHYDTPQVFKQAGYRYIVSPAVRNYAGPFLDYLNSFENIQRLSRAGYEDSSAGILTSSWNDYGGEELRELNYYGYAWAAECSWQPFTANVGEFNDQFFRDFFGTSDDDALNAAYAILSSPANHFSWYELWRHPMLPFSPPTPRKGHSPIIMDRLQSIKSTMPIVLSLLSKSRRNVTRNADNLSSLAFVARLNLWFARKVEAQEEVRRLSKSAERGINRDAAANEIIAVCTDVLNRLAPLRAEFEHLWLRTNKPDGLENLLKRWDRQASYWREKIDQVKRGEFWVDPELASDWIYHPVVKGPDGDSVRVQHAFFRKQFVRPIDVRTAMLQLIGDTYGKVWVNAHFVGEVYARRSNSLSAEYQRIRTFNILSLLNDTANVIAVEAQDFSTTGSAGVNIYCELQRPDGSVQTLMTDTTWKVSDAATGAWQGASFDDSHWTNSVTKPYPYTIVRPDFASGRNSWIEP
jgi:hexosaminidase